MTIGGGKASLNGNNVRTAKPLFQGHNQPRIPHSAIGYYDLKSKSFLKYQHDMSLDHGVYGFC
ncbi:glycoside hydrolase family 99-like domain-containing protein [Desulfonatronum parangueonense]